VKDVALPMIARGRKWGGIITMTFLKGGFSLNIIVLGQHLKFQTNDAFSGQQAIQTIYTICFSRY
jgi:hypothetical protein